MKKNKTTKGGERRAGETQSNSDEIHSVYNTIKSTAG